MSGLSEADRLTRMKALRAGLSGAKVCDVDEHQSCNARTAILDAARQAVTVDRVATHGAPEDTFGLIAALWSARLGVKITSAQVCILLVDLKTARAWGNPAHADNWIDIAGYAACGGEVAGVAND